MCDRSFFEGKDMGELKLGFVAEIGGGKTASATYVKTLYPGTPSVRFSDSLREFIAWFNEGKMAGEFAGGDRDQLEYALEEGLCASFPWDLVARALHKEKLLQFVDWILYHWLSDANEIKVDRITMQNLSTALRSIFAENILERAVIAQSSRHNSGSSLAVIEGIRRLVDIGTLLSEPDFKLIYLECDPKVAYVRTLHRNENPGDAEMTYEEFLSRRGAEAEAQIRMLKPYAHLVIDNSGEIAELEAALERAILSWISAL